MRLPQALLFLLALFTTIHAFAVPDAFHSAADSSAELFKRKGGGGGRGGGSFGSSGGTRGSGSTSSSGSRGLTSSTSNIGGRTSTGSGVAPRTFSGGRFFGGGAAVPYKSGSRSGSGIAPALLLGTAALAVFPGIWLFGAFSYHYPQSYTYQNMTTNANETHPVQCWCGQFAECACDPNNGTDYVNSIANNKTIAHVADVNGTQTLLINGTLPNGTTAAGAAGSVRFGGAAELTGWSIVAAGLAWAMWAV